MTHARKSAAFFMSAALLAFAASAFAGHHFEGVWKVKDTAGEPFEITLSKGGKATATRQGEDMTGAWTESDDGVTISWDTGWTTKITKEGDGYKKTAYDKGKEADAEPASDAEKVK